MPSDAGGSRMAAKALWVKTDRVEWQGALQRYDDAIAATSKEARKKDLKSLDDWYRESRASEAAGARLTHAELCKVMEWKLTRGKYRPSLPGQVRSNEAESVESCTADGLKHVTGDTCDVRAAIAGLTKLRGIGPATASAVLAVYRGDVAPFMADEAYDAVPGLPANSYKLPQYIGFQTRLRDKGNELGMGAEDVGRALWAAAVCEKYGLVDDGAEGADGASDVEASASGSSGKGKRGKKTLSEAAQGRDAKRKKR